MNALNKRTLSKIAYLIVQYNSLNIVFKLYLNTRFVFVWHIGSHFLDLIHENQLGFVVARKWQKFQSKIKVSIS